MQLSTEALITTFGGDHLQLITAAGFLDCFDMAATGGTSQFKVTTTHTCPDNRYHAQHSSVRHTHHQHDPTPECTTAADGIAQSCNMTAAAAVKPSTWSLTPASASASTP